MLERRAELSGRMRSALVYPAILVCLALVSMGILGGVLVPSIAPLFLEGGKPMPTALAIAHAVHQHWLEATLAILSLLAPLSVTSTSTTSAA